jgi:hypothetical protein
MDSNSTPIAQSGDNTMNEMQNGDENSQIVNEILNEMGKEQMDNQPNSQMNIEQQQMHQNNAHLERQLDQNVNMMSMDGLEQPNQEMMMHRDMEVGVLQEEDLKTRIFDKVKYPLLVILVTFLTFSPIIGKLLQKYLPRLFNSMTPTNTTIYLGLLLKAVITGVMYFTAKNFL